MEIVFYELEIIIDVMALSNIFNFRTRKPIKNEHLEEEIGHEVENKFFLVSSLKTIRLLLHGHLFLSMKVKA